VTATKKAPEKEKAIRRGWRLAAGGAFLLLFGLTLGVLLSKSIRPRASQQESITGDFLTGTGPGGIGSSSGMAGMAGMEMGASSPTNISSLLTQGRDAYERQQWSQAIEAFKKALAMDPNHPEAHTYMGLILGQTGHADGALMAFDRALSSNPNLPLALWGKGMVLYQTKQDLSGARQTLEKLVSLLPPGDDSSEIQKTLTEIAQLSTGQTEGSKIAKTETSQGQIRGTISLDPKLKAKLDNTAVLFVVARSANSPGGPPLAVKRIQRPVFPVSYALGQENVMIAGVALGGKVNVSARLDRDGNPATREPGDLAGEYKKNPVEIGSEKVDIIIDQVIRQ
jgi:cytochrome c-type biogenesis protein CcmH